ncbi:hypothetical protein BWI17_18100 [Betaproteobacteria bacterium GR16-43]|nr:hypothetical protein BWI17_18100 [Betaproteobacteria bacterium GR16-43]
MNLKGCSPERIAGAALVAYGIVVIAGWILHWPMVVRLGVPGQLIVVNAALCALLAGLAFIFRRRKLAFAGAIAAVACVTLVQRAFDLQWGTDLPALHATMTADRLFPGRMNWNTSLAFLLLSLALGAPRLLPGRWGETPAWAVGVLALGMADMGGQLLRLDLLFDGYARLRMSYGNSAVMVLSGLALLWRWRRDGLDGKRSPLGPGRRILVAAASVLVGMVVVTGISTLAFSIRHTRIAFEEEMRERLTSHARRMSIILEDRIEAGRMVATRPMVREALARATQGTSGLAAAKNLEANARDLLKSDFSTFIVNRMDGREVIRVGHPDPMRFAVPLEGTTHSAWLAWDNGPLLRQVIPVIEGTRQVGWAQIEQRVPRLGQVLADVSGLGRSGEIAVCSLDDQNLTCLPRRFDMKPHRMIPIEADGRWLPTALAARGEVGAGEIGNPRDRLALTAWGPVGETGLGMSIRMNASEVFEQVREELLVSMPVFLLCLGVGLVLIVTQVAPVVKRLRASERMAIAVNSSLMRVTQRLEASERQMRTIADNLPVLVAYVDREHRYTFANDRFQSFFGIAREEAIGKTVAEVLGAEGAAGAQRYIEMALAGSPVTYERIDVFRGRERHVHASYLPDMDEDGNIMGFFAMLQDVTVAKRAELELQRLARFDSLTGLPNRLMLDERIVRAQARSARADAESLALLFLDLDKFKAVNDTHGHDSGDAVLKEFARRMQACVRRTDTVARLAGDEFVVLLEGLKDKCEAELVAAKIIAAMALPIVLPGDLMVVVGTSIGIAPAGDPDESSAQWLKRADAALYRAKAAGRRTVAVDVRPDLETERVSAKHD